MNIPPRDEAWFLSWITIKIWEALWGKAPEPKYPEPVEESQIDLQVLALRNVGDRDSLFEILDREKLFTSGIDAAEALAQLGDSRGTDHLVAMLNHPSGYLREMARASLTRLNDPRADIVQQTQDSTIKDMWAIPPSAITKDAFLDPDIETQVKLLESEKAAERYNACEELRVQATLPYKALQALREAIYDADPLVADAAVRALAMHEQPNG